jgi:hypothetical protein
MRFVTLLPRAGNAHVAEAVVPRRKSVLVSSNRSDSGFSGLLWLGWIGCMPNNERRKEWLAEVTVAGLERVWKMEVLYLKILKEFLRKYMALEMSQSSKVPVTSS